MQETREKILHAAYLEFEAHGYTHASTNRIVEAAGVSKGTLFNYFGSKEKLYNACIEQAIEITEESTTGMLYEETGFIERMYEMMQFKQAFQMKHPALTQFLSKSYLDRSLPEEYQKRMDQFTESSLNQLFTGIDHSRFRDDLPEETMMDLIRWTLDGYAEQMQKLWQMGLINLDNLEPHYEAFHTHLAVMKKLYYKE